MDKFNDIWKNRFNEEEISTDAWNNPSSDVWANILAEIPEEKPKRKGLLWFWLLPLLLFIGSVGYKYITITKTNHPQVVLNELKNNSENNLLEISLPLMGNTSDENSQEVKMLHKDNSVRNALNTAKKIDSNLSFETIQTSTLNTETIESTIIIDEEINIHINNKMENSSLEIENELATENPILDIVSIDNISIYTIDYETTIPDFKLLKERNNQEVASPLSMSVSTGIVYWQHQLNAEYLSALNPFEFAYNDNIGFNTQLNFNYQLSQKIRISTGISYDRVSIQSGHNSNLNYQLQKELGESQNKYFLALATPYGFVNSEFDVQRVEDVSNQNIDLNANVHSTQVIQNIAIPINVGLKLIEFNRFNADISTGLGVNYMLKVDNQLNEVNPNHSAFKYNDNGAKMGLANINHWHLDYRLGLLLNYSINENTALNLQYSYAKGLNAIYKTSDFDTRINRHYFSLSFTKIL